MTNKALKTLGVILGLALAAAAQSLPAGTPITVRLNQELSSATAKTGQAWEGTLARNVVINGKAVAKKGAAVKGIVTSAKPSGRLKDPGVLALRLTSVDINGTPTRVHSTAFSRQGKSHTKSNATKIGGGAAAGAVIGAIAGGGKGAAIGTLAGGAAGTGAAAYTGKMDVVLPAESAVTFTITGAPPAGHTTKRK